MTTISLIAAVAENGVIGKDGDLPWRIKSELQYFKKTTIGKPVIHGRKSFESLGGALPKRPNIVITRDKNYTHDDSIIVVHSIEDAMKTAEQCARDLNVDEFFVAGGAGVYEAALPLCQKLYLTEIHMTPDGDTVFPDFDKSDWVEEKREFHKAQDGETADYTITILTRKKSQ